MKKYVATFKKTVWFNGGMRETTVKREIEARTEKSAINKAKKMQAYGKARTWYIYTGIEEA